MIVHCSLLELDSFSLARFSTPRPSGAGVSYNYCTVDYPAVRNEELLTTSKYKISIATLANSM